MASDQIGGPQLRPVILERMPQQSGLLGTDDDSTGFTSFAERRKIQNRLNQRAYSGLQCKIAQGTILG
jgi:hypothetical protein